MDRDPRGTPRYSVRDINRVSCSCFDKPNERNNFTGGEEERRIFYRNMFVHDDIDTSSKDVGRSGTRVNSNYSKENSEERERVRNSDIFLLKRREERKKISDRLTIFYQPFCGIRFIVTRNYA